MGRKLRYKAGSHYMVDDRTGFPTRSERVKREWDGLMVDEARWEARQPQDYVRGRRDDQTVDVARPLAPNFFPVGPIYLTLDQDVEPGSTSIPVESASGVSVGDLIGVMMPDGDIWRSGVWEIDGSTLQITSGVPLGALSGAQVIDFRTPYATDLNQWLETENGQQLDTESGQKILLEHGPGSGVAPNEFELDVSQLGGPDVLG